MCSKCKNVDEENVREEGRGKGPGQSENEPRGGKRRNEKEERLAWRVKGLKEGGGVRWGQEKVEVTPTRRG